VWALERGSRSGRVAYQFARDYAGQNDASTLVASRTALPPEGANFPRGGPSENSPDRLT
jgi:hypothetical protein